MSKFKFKFFSWLVIFNPCRSSPFSIVLVYFFIHFFPFSGVVSSYKASISWIRSY